MHDVEKVSRTNEIDGSLSAAEDSKQPGKFQRSRSQTRNEGCVFKSIHEPSFKKPVTVPDHDPRASPPSKWASTNAANALLRHVLRTLGPDALVQQALERRDRMERYTFPEQEDYSDSNGGSLASTVSMSPRAS